MKAIKLVFAAMLLLGVFVSANVQGQAIVVKDGVHYLFTGYDLYESISHMTVETPSGNLLFKATFMLDPNDPWVPEKGVNKVPVWFMGYLIDHQMIVKANGEATLIYHANGSGTETPNNVK